MSTITISQLIQAWSYGGSTATLRIYASEPFITSTGVRVVGGKTGSDNYAYTPVTCTISGGNITIPATTVYSTDDSRDRPDVTYTAIVYDTSGTPRQTLAENFSVPNDIASPTTWSVLALLGDTGTVFPSADYVPTTDTTIVAINRTVYLEAYASLAAAITAIGATSTELKVTTNTSVPASATIPATTKVTFEGNGRFTVAAGQTLTIGLMTDPGNKQVFAQADSTANIRFTKGATPRINLAWFVGPTTGATITNAMNQALSSCSTNGGGNIYVPEGTWLTAGNHSVPSETTIEGAGNHVDNAAGPTIIRMTATGVPVFKLATANVHNLLLQNLLIDGDNKANVDGFYGTGSEVAGDYSGEITFNRVTITQCVNGIRFFSSAGVWLVRAVHLIDCIITANSFSGIRLNTSNNALILDTTNFGVPAGAYALYFNRVGNAHIKGCEFYGIPGYFGTRQVLTNTVVAPAGITGNGAAKVVWTDSRVSGSPRNISIPGLTTGSHTTAALIATAIRTALATDSEFDRLCKAGGTGADITFTCLLPETNVATANFTIQNDTCTGITDDLTSTITTAGVARTGMAEAVCYIDGAHGAITFQSCQDEAFKYFIVNDASDVASIINIQGCLVQAEILLNQTCTIASFGNSYLSRSYIDSTSGNSSRITSVGDYVRAEDAYGNTFSPAELAGPRYGSIITVETQAGVSGFINFRRPTRFFSSSVDDGTPTVPVASYGYATVISGDKILGRWGLADTKGTLTSYLDLKRIYATNSYEWNLSAAGSFVFNADVSVPDEVYDATAWNGSLEVPTKNAVRDKIEDILDGVTFTGDIVVPAEVYGVGWNGSNEAPTKNDVYDKIEDILDGVAFTGQITAPSIVLGSGSTVTKFLSATATLDFPSIAAQTGAELTITVTGAATGNVAWASPSTSMEAGLVWSAYVSATNTVTIRVANVTSGAVDPASKSWTTWVIS